MSTKPKLLLVDDEPGILKFLRAGLSADEFEFCEASSGKEAVNAAATFNPSLILLDLGLPDIDGLTVIQKIREWSKTPIIILSARDKEGDKILALDLGADDYLTKPFSVGELKARLRAHLRRIEPSPEGFRAYKFGEIEVDFPARSVKKRGAEVHLTPLEYQLLTTLVKHADKVVPHKILLREVWGPAYERQTQYLRVFMGNLRQKLEDDPTEPIHLKNEPGVGYRLVTTTS